MCFKIKSAILFLHASKSYEFYFSLVTVIENIASPKRSHPLFSLTPKQGSVWCLGRRAFNIDWKSRDHGCKFPPKVQPMSSFDFSAPWCSTTAVRIARPWSAVVVNVRRFPVNCTCWDTVLFTSLGRFLFSRWSWKTGRVPSKMQEITLLRWQFAFYR